MSRESVEPTDRRHWLKNRSRSFIGLSGAGIFHEMVSRFLNHLFLFRMSLFRWLSKRAMLILNCFRCYGKEPSKDR